MKRHWTYAALLWALAAAPLTAQVRTPTYSNEFLNIGVGARSLALGGSHVALAQDATAGYWNPAGLHDLPERHSLALMHAEWFGGIASYDYGAFATRLDSNLVLGLSAIRLGVDDIPDTRFLFDANGAVNYDNVQFFSAADYAFLLSLAYKFPWAKQLRLGGNVKVIHRTVGQFATAWGFGVDLGLRYETGHWRLGALVQDATGTFNAWSINSALLEDAFATTGNSVPEQSVELTLPKVILGAAFLTRWHEHYGVAASLDLVTTTDGRRNTLLQTDAVSVDPRLGLELDYKKLFYLRGGVYGFQEIKQTDGSSRWDAQPAAGLGIRYRGFGVDYALTNAVESDDGLLSHVFSLHYDFSTLPF